MSPVLNVFIPLQKVDMAKRQIWGVAAVEQPDRSKPPEIMDYERSKPHFLAWSATMQKASNGLSLGNVRAMHGGQLMAVGRVIHLEPRDDKKDIHVGIEIVDDAAWEKVTKGVYTGFSIGGSYGSKWPDDVVKGAIRYEAVPNELSLADLSCIPGATFEVIKADGASELHKFAQAEEDKPAPGTNDQPPAEGEQPPNEGQAPAGGEQPGADRGASPQENNQPDPGAETTSEASAPASETPESAPSGAEGDQPANEQESLNAETVKSIVISLLMELGLVQPSGAQPMSMAIKIDGLSKAVQLSVTSEQLSASGDQLQKAFGDQLAELRKTLTGDIAQIVAAVQTLEKRGSSGPVIRDLGAISPQVMADLQKASVLKDLAKDTEDPLTRQKLQEEITRLEIKAVQANKPS